MNTIVINTREQLEDFLTPLFEKFMETFKKTSTQPANYMSDELLTKKEVLKITKYKDSWFYYNLTKLKAFKINGEWRVKFSDLQDFLNEK
ncbi:MAG: hypothetical protein JXR68_14285 [Bacteroidales bacterium]|nr:hypothetical protein [Bacteroidales bacterium]